MWVKFTIVNVFIPRNVAQERRETNKEWMCVREIENLPKNGSNREKQKLTQEGEISLAEEDK